MNARSAFFRRIASALLGHAAEILPPERATWGTAMKNEIDSIENDFESLQWAAGCVFASYFERSRHMDQQLDSFGAMVKRPSAFLPMTMSLTALALLGGAYVFGLATGQGGLVREPDEGSIAHLWQILMAGQLPLLLFFAIKWLPRAPKQTLYVLGLQTGAALAAMAPVYLLHL